MLSMHLRGIPKGWRKGPLAARPPFSREGSSRGPRMKSCRLVATKYYLLLLLLLLLLLVIAVAIVVVVVVVVFNRTLNKGSIGPLESSRQKLAKLR